MPCTVDLRQQIEELALRLVMSGPEPAQPPAKWTFALEAIRQSAIAARADAVAAAAEAALQQVALAAGREDAITPVAVLQDAIARLQQALDTSASANPPTVSAAGQIAQDPELLADFALESREHLAAIESHVLVLERDPANSEALHATFRGFHTIKGLAGFLELWEVQKLAHEVETVLDRARNGELTITSAAIDVVLLSADRLRQWLAYVESGLRGEDSTPPTPDEALVERIRSLYSTSEADSEAKPDNSLAALANQVESAAPATAVEDTVSRPAAAAPARRETLAVKVDTAKLDFLVDMAGEMVIAESLVRHDRELAGLKSPQLQRKMAQLSRITAELQRTAMSMRLVTIGPLFRRMARLVRDLSRQFSKRVELETTGDEIELDRTIVEELSDPLMHMVRNSLDHGIESAQERQERGKPAVAHVYLKAHHQSGQVVVEVADDGRGLDRESIRAKAIERGLVPDDQALSDNETYNLIFEPGFSTARTVSSVSGRGVGMDVVRKHIEKLRGRIEIRSTPGSGSSFLLKLPLTLAIIDGLVVGVGPERYIVPLFTVREMFRPQVETIWTVQNRVEMALVRGSLLPVLRLYRRFRVTPRSENPLESILIVAEVEGQRFCLLVDELVGKQEVVIKALGETFKSVTGISGGAILGDGRVGLILDVDRLYKERHSDSDF
jgi:two-component system, chemotaxis family, sensor kinase CheA